MVALFNALEQARLLKTNQLLQQALRELEVEQEFQVAVGEVDSCSGCAPSSNPCVVVGCSRNSAGAITGCSQSMANNGADCQKNGKSGSCFLGSCQPTVEVMVGAYGLKGEIGKCPAGKALTLEQCKNEVSFGKKWGGSGNYGKWYSPESCGCYIDQNGKRYFNTNTWYCTSDVGEKLICVVPEPPKTCHNTFRFLETKDGQCSASVTFPSRSLSCPKNYARIRTEKECRELLTKNSKNIHWRGSTSPFTSNWPKGCVIQKKRNFYQGYFNIKSSECNTCDTDVAPVCKLV